MTFEEFHDSPVLLHRRQRDRVRPDLQIPAIFQITTLARYLEYTGHMWITMLEENDIAVLPVDSEHVRLTDDDQSAVSFVLNIPKLARPHDIKSPPERRALLVAHSITSEALDRALGGRVVGRHRRRHRQASTRQAVN